MRRWVTAVVAALAAVLLAGALLPAPASADRAKPRKRIVPCSRGLVALTFDDGPLPSVTPHLLRILRRERVPATFFMVGNRVAAYPELVRAVAATGSVIGNHTWAHERMTSLTDAELRHTLRSTRRALQQALHPAGLRPSTLVRPPYGDVDARVRRVIGALGGTTELWTIDSEDWTGLSTARIRSGVIDAVRPHADNVVLQHDGVTNSPASVAAVPGEIDTLRRRGYCFTTLDDAGRLTVPVPVARISVRERRVDEGGRLRVRVELDRPTTRPTTVRVSAADGLVRDRVVRFRPGQTRRSLRIRLPQDRVDQHRRRLVLLPEAGAGTTAAGSVRVRVVDDDPAPVVGLGDVRVTADPLLDVPAVVPVRLDRPSDRAVTVVVRSPLGRVLTTLPAGSRSGEVVLTVPPGSPADGVRDLPVRAARARHARAGAEAHLVVEPPALGRRAAVRRALAGITWPRVELPRAL